MFRTLKAAVPEGADTTEIKTGDAVRAVVIETVGRAVKPAPKHAPH